MLSRYRWQTNVFKLQRTATLSTIISVQNLCKEYSYYQKDTENKSALVSFFSRKTLTKTAVSNLSLQIQQGEIVGFLGPNGAGKTTTLKMLSGILRPSSGSATVLGYTPWERQKEFKQQFSIVLGQKGQLWWDLPAIDSLILNKYIYEINDTDYQYTLAELSELLDVKELLNVQVRRLSLGERMKMEIIAALIHKPKVIFLDEPTIGLDIISQKRIREFLKFYNQQEKTTIILTSHYMSDIEDLTKRSIVIKGGNLVFDGDLKNVGGNFYTKKILKVQFTEEVDINTLNSYGTIKNFAAYSAEIEVEKANLPQIVNSIWSNFNVADFNINDISIEDAIISIYNQQTA